MIGGADSAVALLRRTPLATGRARLVPLPPAARELSTLDRLDYADAYLVETEAALDRSAEEWARRTLEQTPLATRGALRWGWFSLGLELGRSEPSILGWRIRSSAPDHVLLAAGSRLGLSAEVLFRRQRGALLFATFVQLHGPVARAAWAGVPPVHRQVVLYLLERAVCAGAPAADRRG